MDLKDIRNNRMTFEGNPSEYKHCLSKVRIGTKQHTVDHNLVNLNLCGIRLKGQLPISTEPLNPELMDFQVGDVEKGLRTPQLLNTNKMGRGKTIEAIEITRLCHCKKVLIVCPKITIPQWRTQLRRWWADYPGMYPSTNRELNKLVFGGAECFTYVTNYEQIKPNLELLKGIQWDMIILDEAHRIKNRAAQRTMALQQLKSVRKQALTGTPITRYPDDLFSILHWLNPVYSGASYWAWVEKFCEVEETFFGKSIVGLTKDPVSREQLKDLLDQVTVCSTSIMPEQKIVIQVDLEMNKAQNKAYKDTQKLLLEELDKQGISVVNGMTKVLRMHQISSNPELFNIQGTNPKFQWIEDLLEDNPELKIVVYSRFLSTVQKLKALLQNHGYEVAEISGEIRDKETEKQKFLSTARVLVGTIQALGTGTDGLQNVCHVAVFIDRTQIPSETEQAEDRLKRPGQTETVLIYHLCVSALDKRIDKVRIKRADDIKELLL